MHQSLSQDNKVPHLPTFCIHIQHSTVHGGIHHYKAVLTMKHWLSDPCKAWSNRHALTPWPWTTWCWAYHKAHMKLAPSHTCTMEHTSSTHIYTVHVWVGACEKQPPPPLREYRKPQTMPRLHAGFSSTLLSLHSRPSQNRPQVLFRPLHRIRLAGYL